MSKIGRNNQKQIDWTFNTSRQLLNNYINKDLSNVDVWTSFMNDANSIVEKTNNDCLTEHIVFAVCQYLEDIAKSERKDNPVLTEPVKQEPKGFSQEPKGFVQESQEPEGFKVGG